jgi:hypothetical protein
MEEAKIGWDKLAGLCVQRLWQVHLEVLDLRLFETFF